jgi:F0F1-type ATP synthase membrane subunit a
MKHNRIVQEIKGMALVMVLVIVTVTAGMLAVIMYYSMTGSEVSGIQRRYQSAKEASLGAMDVVTKEIITRVLQQNVVGGATQDLTYVSWPNSGLLQEPGLQHVRTRTPVNK